jgi:hypothetical protein
MRMTEDRGRVVNILLRIREVSGSDICPETGYFEAFRGFPNFFQDKCWDSTFN